MPCPLPSMPTRTLAPWAARSGRTSRLLRAAPIDAPPIRQFGIHQSNLLETAGSNRILVSCLHLPDSVSLC